MANTVDYLPVATAAGANVDSQANFNGSGYQQDGFASGIAQPYQANKIWRQSSMIGAAVANFVSQLLAVDVLDDGDLTNLISNFTAAVKKAALEEMCEVVTVPFSATPVFDASQGSTFEMVLSASVTASSITNATPGQRLKIVLTEDATGGHTFVGPTAKFPNIDTAASKINVQNIYIDAAGTPLIDGPLTVN
ncbi:MAG: hypothetical protein ACLGPM_07755 [Acidobacteriota bacterium]